MPPIKKKESTDGRAFSTASNKMVVSLKHLNVIFFLILNINYLKSEYTGKALLPVVLATWNICRKLCPKTTQVMLINLGNI